MDRLGRGLVCLPGARVPPEFAGLPRVDDLEEMHRCWLSRTPVVIELRHDKAELKARERWTGDVYRLTPRFEFERERRHFLTWANNYDGTLGGEPVWWHGRLARKLGAQACDTHDVLLADGPAWCDGGPRGLADVLHRETIEAGQLHRTRAAEPVLELADDQRVAVLHGSGPARILAPAGSGKTRVLTERLKLMVARGYEQVTALAYNRRAAEEMRSRAPGVGNVSTLHALGYRVLRDKRLIDEREVRTILRGLVDVPQALGQDPLAPYVEALGEVRLALRDPGQVEARRGDVPGFASAFPRYREQLRRRGLIDHDEQIYGALEVLLAEPEIRRQAQRACTHLLVDEFQDLTPAYLLLVRLLSAPAYQVYGVGDDDQVIYGYSGATPEFLVRYADYFPGAAEYALEVNYRCPATVVEAAGRLLKRNRQRVPKEVRPGPDNGSNELVVLRTSHLDRAAHAVRHVQGWLESHPPTSVAVLTRVQASLMAVQVYLAEAGIPYDSILGASVLERTGARTALAYLRLARGRWTPADLQDCLKRPNRKLRREVIESASRCQNADQLADLADSLEPWPSGQLLDLGRDLRVLGSRREPAEALVYLREQVGLGDAMRDLDGAGAEASHYDDLVALEQTARLNPDWHTFELWLRGELARPNRPGVRLSTVHRVKGMEWDCVLVYGAQKGLMPHRLADDREEERRIFHVAITRARVHCAVLADEEEPSPFLAELKPKSRKKASRRGYEADYGQRFAEALGVPLGHLETALEQLPERDREVFCWRYGLTDGQRHDWNAIAKALDQPRRIVETWEQMAVFQLGRSLGKLDLEKAFREL